LAWKLSLVENNLAPPHLLDSYNAERLPVITVMLDKTTELLKAQYTQGASGEEIWSRPRVLKMLGITYRGSPIIVDHERNPAEPIDPYRSGEDGKVLAGDRAPNATIGLHGIFGVTHHTVLIFGEDIKYIQQGLLIVKEWKAPVKTIVIAPKGKDIPSVDADYVLADVDGSAYINYRAERGPQVAVVRPDGVLGARSGQVDILEDYAKAIFI
jgi:hypothetical protein